MSSRKTPNMSEQVGAYSVLSQNVEVKELKSG